MVNLAARLAARADAEHEGCVLCDQFTIQVLSAVIAAYVNVYALWDMSASRTCNQ
jgi:hypothetical protein